MTVRQLLDHRSGIRAYRSDEETVSTRHYASIEDALDGFKDDPLVFVIDAVRPTETGH